MRDTVRLDWRVPARPYEQLVENVKDEYGQKDGYIGRELEAAMREHIDMDGYNTLERKLNRLVEAAGRTPASRDREKKYFASVL